MSPSLPLPHTLTFTLVLYDKFRDIADRKVGDIKIVIWFICKKYVFLDTFSHLYNRVLVGQSVGRSINWSLCSLIRHIQNEFLRNELNWNKIALGILNYAIQKTIQRLVRGQKQNASVVCTLSDLFYSKFPSLSLIISYL